MYLFPLLMAVHIVELSTYLSSRGNSGV